jgi:hypothetical protein
MLVGTLAGVLALAGGLAFVLWPGVNPLQAQNVFLIQEGMPLTEVEMILGGPPDDYRTGPTRAVWPPGSRMRLFPSESEQRDRWRLSSGGDRENWDPRLADWRDEDWWLPQASFIAKWDGDAAVITVGLDNSGCAVWAEYVLASRVEQRPLDNFFWRVKQQWRRWFP